MTRRHPDIRDVIVAMLARADSGDLAVPLGDQHMLRQLTNKRDEIRHGNPAARPGRNQRRNSLQPGDMCDAPGHGGIRRGGIPDQNVIQRVSTNRTGAPDASLTRSV